MSQKTKKKVADFLTNKNAAIYIDDFMLEHSVISVDLIDEYVIDHI